MLLLSGDLLLGSGDPALGGAGHLSCDLLSIVISCLVPPLVLVMLHLLNKFKGVLVLEELGNLRVVVGSELIVLLVQCFDFGLSRLKLSLDSGLCALLGGHVFLDEAELLFLLLSLFLLLLLLCDLLGHVNSGLLEQFLLIIKSSLKVVSVLLESSLGVSGLSESVVEVLNFSVSSIDVLGGSIWVMVGLWVREWCWSSISDSGSGSLELGVEDLSLNNLSGLLLGGNIIKSLVKLSLLSLSLSIVFSVIILINWLVLVLIKWGGLGGSEEGGGPE